jgi:hypothetical protein
VQRSFNQLNWEIYSRLFEFHFRDVQTFPSVVRKQFKVFHNVFHDIFHDAWKSLSVVKKQIQGFLQRFSRRLDKFERREKAIQGFSRRFSRRLESLSVVKLKLRES